MEALQEWFEQRILDNSVGDIVLFASIVLMGLLLKRGLSLLLSRLFYRVVRQEAGSVPFGEFARLMRSPLEFLILLIVLYVAFDRLTLPSHWNLAPRSSFGFRLVIAQLYQTTVIVTVTWIAIRFVKCIALIFQRRAQLTETKLDDQLVPFIRDLLILGVSTMGFFAALDLVYNVNVVALVTSLGIGGLAIALAARETLENLFASFAILLDQPFITGDAVTAGTGPNQVTGTVEKIGFRSTRLRTDDGSLIAVPNRLMISQSLDNLTKRSQRRVRFFLRLTLETPAETLQAVVSDIRQLLADDPMTNENPALIQFDAFGESSFDILIQYYVATVDWREFNRIKEQVNYRLIEIVLNRKGQFAFPAQMLYLRDQSGYPLEQS